MYYYLRTDTHCKTCAASDQNDQKGSTESFSCYYIADVLTFAHGHVSSSPCLVLADRLLELVSFNQQKTREVEKVILETIQHEIEIKISLQQREYDLC